ncbi:MAG: 4-hydroxy-tetrahydrodipicolinate reductase [Sphingomonadaceae bacterium]|nr:4-hydroxy-tetrahydrodipicolinate reductase [Sphingomonadaceae bacterium]
MAKSATPVRIGVLGAGGRMGREVIAAVRSLADAALAGAVEHADHPCVGTRLDEGHVVGANVLALAHAAQVLVDFTEPASLAANLDAATAAGCAIVIGTTGLTPAQQAAIDAAARHIAVLYAANMSLGVNLLAGLVREAAARLPGWDIELLELHHGMKADAPSGTALMLADAAAAGRKGGAYVRDRASRPARRQAGEIGMATLRGGTSAGEHEVWLLGPGERIELNHRAESRAVFAQGAVRAALWLAGRQPGRYAMADVLGLAHPA